ncbi:MAG: zinc-ribbon domain-containing protein [Anaerolineae bacterium]
MQCPQCGTENRPQAKFCQKCGANLQTGTIPAPQPVAQPSVDAASQPLPEGAAQIPGPREDAEAEAVAVMAPPEATAPQVVEEQLDQDAISGQAPAGVEERIEEAVPAMLVPPTLPVAAESEKPDEEPPVQPLDAGTVLKDHYEITALLSTEEGFNLYEAHDLLRCWQCEAEITPGDRFCPECGAEAEKRATCYLREGPKAKDIEKGLVEKPREVFTENGRAYAVVDRLEAEPEAPPFPHGVRLVVGKRSDPGMVRDLDEDSILTVDLSCICESRTGPTIGFYAVADGMGGHEGGELASKLALQVLADRILNSILLPELSGDSCLVETIIYHLKEATQEANKRIFTVRREKGTEMGTTLTTALVRDSVAYVANVGDSRTYVWGQEGLKQVTTDHSVVASLIATGMAQPEELYTHPQRNVVYRSLGDKSEVEIDTFVCKLTAGDRLILCCDGLWEAIRDEGIEEIMLRESNPQIACDELVRMANLAGGEDNISVIVVKVEAMTGIEKSEHLG